MRRVIALAIAGALMLSGCVSGPPDASASVSASGNVDEITVGNADDGKSPTLDIPEGKVWDTAQTEVLWEGDGDQLVDGQPLLLDMYGISLADGSELINSYKGLARSFLLAPELLGQDLYDALLGARVGTRILHVSPAPADNPDGEPPIALVIDVLPTHAVGTAVDPLSDMPVVTTAADGTPSVTIGSNVQQPTDLQVVTLVQGAGEQVRTGSFVMVNFTMVSWDGEVLDSSWPEEVAPLEVEVGSGQSIQAIEDGLLDQTVGSQLLILAPASYAYPDKGPVVLVVDILDVFTPEDS
ncbi:FKBP-type peptidyl-prolyl cis-trans isomerase [Demequina capsici]|uniref:Peptidyl-prolyl cis-trans isomerase n=1 Tax=Demequina capsici TaxID=3075620 RepID=A0AA96J5N4_9MICO|nr:FKBP-type peptidyl-prolyl cis-trans isomerase [Demequina sp. OYTSA14]WNM23187.1 FKBP-type peptidyl-prolyl cis-trans isomerase [Demequina sp. OYTSA14]